MRTLAIVLAALFVASPALATNVCGIGVPMGGACAGDALAWQFAQPGARPLNDAPDTFAMSPDGEILYLLTPGGGFGLVALDATTGAALWTIARGETPAALAASASHVVVAATGGTSSDTRMRLYSFDAATGAQRWVATYDASRSSPRTDTPFGVAVTPDGASVFLVGESRPSMLVASYDGATGAKRWDATTFFGWVVMRGEEVVLSPDGTRVFATGEDSERRVTAAYDAASGSRLWLASRDFASGLNSDTQLLAVSSDGANVFLTERASRGGVAHDVEIVAYAAATGALRWARTFDAGGDEAPQAMAVSADGARVAVVGTTQEALQHPVSTRLHALVIDAADGAVVAADVVAPLLGFSKGWAGAAFSPDGSVLYAAGGKSNTGMGHFAAALDATTLAQRWSVLLGEETEPTAVGTALALSPDGERLHLSGWTGETLLGALGKAWRVGSYDTALAADAPLP